MHPTALQRTSLQNRPSAGVYATSKRCEGKTTESGRRMRNYSHSGRQFNMQDFNQTHCNKKTK
jgi:hypothetical protein